MLKVWVAGASGVLDFNVVKKLKDADYQETGQIYSRNEMADVEPYCSKVVVADLTKPSDYAGICEGVDIVLSTVGKSVSLFTNGLLSFIYITTHDMVASQYGSLTFDDYLQEEGFL